MKNLTKAKELSVMFWVAMVTPMYENLLRNFCLHFICANIRRKHDGIQYIKYIHYKSYSDIFCLWLKQFERDIQMEKKVVLITL